MIGVIFIILIGALALAGGLGAIFGAKIAIASILILLGGFTLFFGMVALMSCEGDK